MADNASGGSPTPVTTTETPAQDNAQVPEAPSVTDEQWRAMRQVLDAIYNHREPDGYDPSKIFHRMVNKRAIPEYYEVIKEPIALSTLKHKLDKREYKGFSEFVRDCALISHNAQTYNVEGAGAYQDALTIKKVYRKQFESLAEQGIISHEVATLPDLGELPPVETPLPVEEEEEDDDDEDEDDEDEDDDTDDEGVKRRRKRGPRSTAAITKREGGSKDDAQKGNDTDPRKRRGRPPRVDTPMESRIKAVLKGIRKYKNELGQIMVHQFEKLPDKTVMPEYYAEIKVPMAIEQIKRKQKRKKYHSVDHFMRDMDIMFNNAMAYNTDESQIYKDAVHLQASNGLSSYKGQFADTFDQAEAHKLADAEKQKPDTEYVMEDGRLPLPGGILHNGELWKVGDWIHIQNPNDVTKPIVAQIYRTWQDTDGEKWINACWYYRPEQTVHQYEKHFFPNEVVKTGQYRDHRIDEIVDRCFVMFTTRYSRGRPRGLPLDKEVYVCDSRYNEEKHKLNKIKTWASCLPDEVRDKDYEMDLFDGLKRVKKVPSPILHLLKEDAKETNELPKPQWGADNAPPIVGAVHKGPRDENQSPPPEATPSPPPQPAPQTTKSANMSSYESPTYRRDSQVDTGSYSQPSANAPTPSHTNHAQSYGSSLAQYSQQTASPAPIHHPHQYTQQASSSYTPHHPSTSSSHLDHFSTPQSRYPPQAAQRIPGPNMTGQRAQSVFHLPENANQAIPEEIRNEFQQDAQGHVLWWDAPPVDTLPPVKPKSAIAHTARYLADKIRSKKATSEKRKAEGLPDEEDGQPGRPAKWAKEDLDDDMQSQIKELTVKALWKWNDQLQEGTNMIYKSLYGEHWEEGKKIELEKLAKLQADEKERHAELAQRQRLSDWEAARASVTDSGVYKDDWDPRF